MVGLFNPSLLVHSIQPFLVQVFWSGTVTKRSLPVKSLSASFDSIKKILPSSTDHLMLCFRMVLHSSA